MFGSVSASLEAGFITGPGGSHLLASHRIQGQRSFDFALHGLAAPAFSVVFPRLFLLEKLTGKTTRPVFPGKDHKKYSLWNPRILSHFLLDVLGPFL